MSPPTARRNAVAKCRLPSAGVVSPCRIAPSAAAWRAYNNPHPCAIGNGHGASGWQCYEIVREDENLGVNRGADHFAIAWRLTAAGWLGCALLQLILYLRPSPYGGP